MAYIEEKKSGKKTRVYLTQNIRINGKFEKVRVFLGYKPVKGLEALAKSKGPELTRKVDEFNANNDEMYDLLSSAERIELERLSKAYNSAFHKFDPITKQKYLDWFLTQFTYDSNAIEGSSVPLEEVSLILFDKVVPSDRNLREVYEVQNHKKAFDFISKYRGDFNLKFVLGIHRRLMTEVIRDAGKIRNVRVFVRGTNLNPPAPEEVEGRLKDLVAWYKSHKSLHPVILAACLHSEFERIHPFRDGNGRTGRLILNFMLVKNKFPPINIRNERKRAYYNALREWDNGNKQPFTELVAGYIRDSVEYVTKK